MKLRNTLTAAVVTGAAVVGALATPSIAAANLAIEPGSFKVETSSLQAGAHPDIATSLAFTRDAEERVGGVPRNVEVELPVGLAGYVAGIPTCAPAQLAELAHTYPFVVSCPSESQVGTAEITLNPSGTPIPFKVPVYNMARGEKQTAVFALVVSGIVESSLVVSVRPNDYGLHAALKNIGGGGVEIDASKITLWGVPASRAHNAERGEVCIRASCFNGNHTAGTSEVPLLRNPTTCTGRALAAQLTVESWAQPNVKEEAETGLGPISGCEHLQFNPEIAVQPAITQAGSPSGYTVDLTLPQNEDPEGTATADLKDAVVTMPDGVVLSPSAAAGLAACAEAQVGLGDSEPVACPPASKIGEATLSTPSLPNSLTGGIYLGGSSSGPITAPPYTIYLTLTGEGVSVKLKGEVQPNPLTGQLTTTFDENPQLPFSKLELHFKGGQRAPLANPEACGTYRATSVLAPWSGMPAAEPFGEFSITSGPGGSACAPSPFAPSFEAGTVNNQGGAFGSFAMTLTRQDGEQRLSTVSMTMPKGLSGMVSKVPLCDEAQANAGTCPAASKIGHVVTEAGVGSEPITLPEPGKAEDPVYLTGPYRGAPYGLSIVVPAEAGPFNLGKVVVRAKIEVDPHTAQVTVLSEPMPTMLQGIPLDIKAIHVDIDRPEFMFNPTSCEPMSVAGSIGSAEGASSTVSSRFQAAGCRGLPFKPSFKALVHAKHSRQDGAYLHVVVKSAKGEANIRRVHVALPEELPSRNETLKKACGEEQFAKDPAGCPSGSFVGHATAYTPMLPVPLSGPAIFVSHGDRGFPDLDVVLHGDGLTVSLTGNTFINKKGVTFSTFASVPDVPISRFDLVLPAGPHSALGATRNLCRHVPTMPTTITAQNGAVVHQKTTAIVTGCRPSLEVVKHEANGGKAVVVVHSPSAGKLIASGRGILQASMTLRKAGSARIVVRLNGHDRQLLATRHGRKLRVLVRLRLKPLHGRALTAKVAVLMR